MPGCYGAAVSLLTAEISAVPVIKTSVAFCSFLGLCLLPFCPFCYFECCLPDGAGAGCVGVGEHAWCAGIAAFADGAVDGYGAEEVDALCFGEFFASVLAEDVVAAAVWKFVVAHVFDEPENGYADFAEHGECFGYVCYGDVLWRGDNDGAGEGYVLCRGDLDVAGAGGKVEDEVVEFVPVDFTDELAYGAGDEWSAPDDGGFVVDEEAD